MRLKKKQKLPLPEQDMKDMEDSANLLETLLERVTEYGKTSIELVKLKTLDKTTDIVSSLVPVSVVILLIASFMLFLNLGLAGIIVHFFLHKWIKRIVGNYLVKRALK
jgi:hypothetical protein